MAFSGIFVCIYVYFLVFGITNIFVMAASYGFHVIHPIITAKKVSVFGVIPVLIFSHSDGEIRSISPYSVPSAGKCRPE